MNSTKNTSLLLKKLGINKEQKGCSNGEEWFGSGEFIDSYSPVNGSLLGKVQSGNKNDYDKLINEAEIAFKSFRKIPSPERGNLVRQLGNKIRENNAELCELVSW